MHIATQQLKPLSTVQLTADEAKILKWMKSAVWEAQPVAHGTVAYKTKVPEFFSGVRLYNMQGGGKAGSSQGTLELFIKKLQYQGIISKQELYPIEVQGHARFLSLKKPDLDNLGIGQEEDEE